MKRTAGLGTLLCTLLLFALASTAQAETLTANVILTPGAEITPPVPPPANATGIVVVTIYITRDGAGAITNAAINFRGTFSFPGPTSVTGFHIHQGAINANGGIRFDSGINTGSAVFFANGTGFIDLFSPNVDRSLLPNFLANPAGYYVNLHTSVNPAGAIRGQITKFIEHSAKTTAMTTAAEVNPPAPLPANASGTGTFTINPVRNPATGEVIGGSVKFTVTCDLPPNSNVTGLHIHQAPAGTNGSIVIDSGIKNTSPVNLPTGKGTITADALINSASTLTALKGLMSNPSGFYMNLHTSANPAGVIRGQLSTLDQPPVIIQSTTQFLTTGNTDVNVGFFVSGIDFSSPILVNGQVVPSLLNSVTAYHEASIPAALRANPGVIYVQAQNNNGLLSAPYAIIVGAADKVNPVAVAVVDAAKFGALSSPDSIVAAFGTNLASQTASASTLPLPISLDGTTAYINGAAAGLFFVSAGQINLLIPGNSVAGPSQIVVLAKDGTISRGNFNTASTIPSIFTRKADGTGAPAGSASVDGQTFNIPISNADGTPAPIDAGNYVQLFGTGMRYPSTAVTVTIGGVAVTPLFTGPQGQFEGLDQLNLQIPASLAGRGEVDLIVIIDAKNSNTTKLRIR